MVGYPEAYTRDGLIDMLDSNSSVPDISIDAVDRIIELAKQRADARGEDNPLEETQTDCIVATDWFTFAEGEFGYDSDDNLNQFSLGVLNMRVSSGKQATLFTDTHVIQQGWLESGDGRKSQVEVYVDDDYDGGDRGDMWVPKNAQDYIGIIKLSDELIHDSPNAADAM